MELGVSIFYIALAALAFSLAVRPERIYAATLIAGVLASNILAYSLPVEASVSINLAMETALIIAATLLVLTDHESLASGLVLLLLSTASVTFSACEALEISPFSNYELLANMVLVAQCLTVSRRGIANGLATLVAAVSLLRDRGIGLGGSRSALRRSHNRALPRSERPHPSQGCAR